jgi:2-polyprenyl-6-methoxyphenol hydroxylase-like FAD-dependent oxidoreductase
MTCATEETIDGLRTTVLIVGGGLTGATAALALAREGIESTIVELNALDHADRWGMTLWPSGLRVLNNLGLLDDVESAGCRLIGLKWYIERSRQWIAANAVSSGRAEGYIGINPNILQRILLQAAVNNGVRMIRPGEVTSVRASSDGWLRAQVFADKERIPIQIECRTVVIADGATSHLRKNSGISARLIQASGQEILTGIGGAVPFVESRQAFGNRWSGGCVPIGKDKTWIYAVVPSGSGVEPGRLVERYCELDPDVIPAFHGLKDVLAVSPVSVRVKRWTNENGCVVLGDAAHSMFPHLGLGGNANLEDVPVLVEVMKDCLRNGISRFGLDAVQRRRESRIRYLSHVSKLFSFSLTSSFPGTMLLRDWNFRRMAKSPELLDRFLLELSGDGVPRFSTRMSVLLP